MSEINGADKNGTKEAKEAKEMVELTIDGQKVVVPAGTNLIEAAASVGITIPHYCYHKDLSIAGNCRMCQIEIKGRPKLEIACNMIVQKGLDISTQGSSQAVKDAQAATLEFILINHPLDCTVCDQSGHCKLQDYHYEYNAKPSRFEEEKVHKVKAEPLGPNVILDGERCIMCTRCIRFCDEITQTSELGLLNRGDQTVIAVNKGKELNNALSGTVVDLCPVGALTHRNWRFNSRIWYAKETESICTGCSTGCNVKVAVRDGQVVQVKAKYNAEVNKEWLCDEGRYGFQRFQPKTRITEAAVKGSTVELQTALDSFKAFKGQDTVVFLSPDLLLEEFWLIKKFLDRDIQKFKTVIAYKERELNDVEKILVSPDYAANFRGAQVFSLGGEKLESEYKDALAAVKAGTAQNIIIIGERAILREDFSSELLSGIAKAKNSIAIISDAESPLIGSVQTVIPERTCLEKAGLYVNRKMRLQYIDRLIDSPVGTNQVWRIINMAAQRLGQELISCANDRDLTLRYLQSDPRLSTLKIAELKNGGVLLTELNEAGRSKTQGGVTAV